MVFLCNVHHNLGDSVLTKLNPNEVIVLLKSANTFNTSIYTSNTLHHLKELGHSSQRAHKTALKLHAHSVHNAHKKQIALKVSVRSRGLPTTLQIPTSFLFPLVGETYGTLSQCVSFSLIDAGSVLLPP